MRTDSGSNTASTCGLRRGSLVKIHVLTWTKYLWICTSLVTMRAPWMGQTESTEFMTSQSPGTKCSFPSTSKTTIYSTLCTSGSDVSHCAQCTQTTHHQHATNACRQFDHRLIIGCGNSKIGYEIIRVSHP